MGLANGIHWHSQWYSPPTDSKINIRRLIVAVFFVCGGVAVILCLKKVPTFKLSVTLSNLNRFSKFLQCWKRMKFATKSIWHYPLHLRHAATLPWEIKNSNFLQMWKKMQTNCILIASNCVIHSQILIFLVFENSESFPILIANKIFHVTVLLLVYFCDQFVAPKIRHNKRHCSVVNNKHGIHGGGQDFDKMFVFEWVHSTEVDKGMFWEKLVKAWR